MPAITITDLSNAKLDVDHISDFATTTAPTVTDRMGNVKPSIAGLSAEYPNASVNAAAAAFDALVAEASRQASGVNAGLAAAAKTQAETARDAAMVSGKVYTTTADGLANTNGTGALNRYFSTPSPDSAESLILYLNSAGVAVEQKRYPGAQLAALLGENASATNALFAVVDANGTVAAYMDLLGGLYLSDSADSVQTRIANNAGWTGLLAANAAASNAHLAVTDLEGNVLFRIDASGQVVLAGESSSLQMQRADGLRRAYAAAVHSLPLHTSGTSAERAAIYAASRHADETLGDAAYLQSQPLLVESYLAGVAYRIATLAKVSDNRLILFCQNTLIPNITTDVQNSQIVAIDLTFNPATKSLTSSNFRILVSHRDIPVPDGPGQTAYASNPTACVIRTGPNAGRILLFYTSNRDNPSASANPEAFSIYSDDGGVTWTTPGKVVAFNGHASGVGEGWCFASGPAGIQLQHGANAGRIVIPSYVYTSGGYGRFVCGYSDDGGATWQAGSRALTTSNETSIAQDIDGTIYASARRSDLNARDLLKSTDGGVTWTAVQLAYLVDPKCNACLFQAASTAYTGPKFFTASVVGPVMRGDLHLRISYGSPDTFAGDLQITSGFAGYCAIEMLNEQDGILVYESPQNYIQNDGSFYNAGSALHSITAVVFNANKVR